MLSQLVPMDDLRSLLSDRNEGYDGIKVNAENVSWQLGVEDRGCRVSL